MCKRITCATCGKPGFSGCGAHVEEVLGDVAPKDRCTCADDGATSGPGLLQRVFGRG